MSAVRDLTKGIELFHAAVLSKLLGMLFPSVALGYAQVGGAGGLMLGGITGLRFEAKGFEIQTIDGGNVFIDCDVVAFKKVFAALCAFDLSTLIGLNEREAIAFLADARDEPHVPDDIELIELASRWVRDNEEQLAVFRPIFGPPRFAAQLRAIDAKRAAFEEHLQANALRFIEGPSLDDIARLAWELHGEGAWDQQTDASREELRGRSLDVIHALRAAGYAIVPPSPPGPAIAHAEHCPCVACAPTLPTGSTPVHPRVWRGP